MGPGQESGVRLWEVFVQCPHSLALTSYILVSCSLAGVWCAPRPPGCLSVPTFAYICLLLGPSKLPPLGHL